MLLIFNTVNDGTPRGSAAGGAVVLITRTLLGVGR